MSVFGGYRISFTEVWLIYLKIHPCEGYSWKSFASCNHLCDCHLNHDVTLLPLQSSSRSFPVILSVADQISPVAEFHVNGIMQGILFCDWLLWSSMFSRFICVACFRSHYFSVVVHVWTSCAFFHFIACWMGWSLLALVIVNPLWPFGQSFCGWIFSFLLGRLVVGLWGHLVNTDLTTWETARPSPQAIVPSCVELGWWCLPGTLRFHSVFTDVYCLSHWHLMSAECPFVVLMYISQVFTVLDIFLHAYWPFGCTFQSNLLPILKIGISVFWVYCLCQMYILEMFSP